jgi:glycosyltransferase involved in cell wall biosynthesis
MSDGHALLRDARVAVITTSLDPSANELWEAARPSVGELLLIGARLPEQRTRRGELALREFDAGRGLIYRHLFGLRRALRGFQPDLVHLNGETWSVTAQELLDLRPPVVIHGAENMWHHGGGLEQAVRRRLVARAVGRMAAYASWNEDGARHVQDLARHAGRDLPTWVMPAIIPPAAFRARSWQPPPLGATSVVELLLVGQVIEKKGFDDVLEACARLERPFHVTVFGKGDEEDELRARAARLGVRLTVAGLVGPDTLAEAMSRSHLLVQPSRTISDWSEQFGRSVAEAMSVGLPCLVSDSGELPVLVGHDASAMFREGNVASLAERLRDLTRSPASLQDLASRQGRSASRYEPTRAGDSLVRFWAGILA